ncbi:cation:proton antiporter [Bacillus tianshenii]|nr:cation:proton antiporter [Bacillus tianshenii]
MHANSLESLLIVTIAAFLVPVILEKFKLKFIPVVVAEIIVGILIGNSGFNLVVEDQWLELLSMLGFIYLMFLSGLEIDFSYFLGDKKEEKKVSFNPLFVAVLIFVLILVISFGLSLLLKLAGMIQAPYLMTLIISTVSLGVVVPVLKERKMLDTDLGQTILLVTVLADFMTMILLAFYVAMKEEEHGTILLIFLLFACVFIVYRLMNRWADNKFFHVLLKGTTQIGTRAVFLLILFFVVLSESLGVESILGAFLAGLIVSLLGPKEEFVEQLDSFGYGFLIPIFFIMIGVEMDLWSLVQTPRTLVFIPALLIAMYAAKLIPSLILRKWFSWHDVLSSGILISAKLSLVIAASAVAMEMDVITSEVNGAIILVSILTCLISPVLFAKMKGNQ